VENEEQCDDGNTVGGDGCSSVCQFEICGNGIVDVGEQCDDSNTISGDGCSSVCIIEFCGDGIVQAGLGEQCDDGNTLSGDGCSSTCQIEVAICGNGIVESGEQCDGGACCTSICAFEPSTTECRTSAGLCDVAESCTGSSAECPADAVETAGTECRASAGVCDVAETCNGFSVSCPADLVQPDGTSCSDTLFCNGDEICQAGVCLSGTPIGCSANNIPGINTCTNIPDGNSVTLDSRAVFISTCNEATDSCTTGALTITHTCALSCGADSACDGIAPGTGKCTAQCTVKGCTSDADCDDGAFCNGAETCDLNTFTCLSGTAPSTDDGVTCTVDSCDETTDTIVHTPNDNLCNDGAFCNGQETCDAINDCQAGTSVDCSANNIGGINTCNNIPDNIFTTLDTRQEFISTCNEAADSCTTGDETITHACDIAVCGAECENDAQCTDTDCDNLDGCVGNDYYDYADVANSCTASCGCELNACGSPTITLDDSRCVEPSVCGNGIVESGEECDDGNTISGDGCSATCTLEISCVVPPSGLVSWWPGNTNANDIIDGNNGLLVGATIDIINKKVGNGSFSFDGVDDHIRIPNNTNLNPRDYNFTIDFWMKTNSSGVKRAIINKRLVCTANSGHGSYWDIRLLGDGKLSAELDQDSFGTNYHNITSNISVNDGIWHHVTLVREANTSTLYIDGNLAGFNETPSITFIENAADVLIGNHTCVNTAEGTETYVGFIDEIEYFNNSLTQAEVRAIYNADIAGKCVVNKIGGSFSVSRTMTASSSAEIEIPSSDEGTAIKGTLQAPPPQTGRITLCIVESNKSDTSDVDFGDPFEIVKVKEYTDDPQINFNTLEINKYANTFFEEKYVGWTEVLDDERVFKYKKTMPHITFLIVLDGLNADKFMEELDAGNLLMIEEMLDEFDSIVAQAKTTFPETTFSTYASIITGLLPKKHKVPGDKFIDSTGADKDFLANPDSVNAYLTTKNVKTIFDYLDSSAAYDSFFNKGMGPDPPNERIPVTVDFTTGNINDISDIVDYLDSLDERDADSDNNAPKFISIYLLSHDHGLSTDPDDINYEDQDIQLEQIIDKLEEKGAIEQSIFIITSDHGFTDVVSNADNAIAQISGPTQTFDLKTNGEIAYHYLASGASALDIRSRAKEIEDIIKDPSSNVFNKIDKIYVKQGAAYKEFVNSNIAGDAPVNFQKLFSLDSGHIILTARPGFYFADQAKEAIEGSLERNVPLIITGKFYEALLNGTQILVQDVSILDIAKTIGFLVGGDSLADAIGVDGANLFAPQFSVFVGSPVNLHLFDSLGRHVGILPDGTLETNIPLSQFEFDNRTKSTEITLLQAPDKYKILVEAYDEGNFTLKIRKNTINESFFIEFPTLDIIKGSTAIIDRITSDSFILQFDFDGDSIFETFLLPDVAVRKTRLEEDIISGDKNITVFIDASAGEFVDVNLIEEIGIRINGTANSNIANGRIDIMRKFDNGFNDIGFFTTNETIEINSPTNIEQLLDNMQIALRYSDFSLGFLSEKSLKVYKVDDSLKTIVPASHNVFLNEFSSIPEFGLFIVASSDQNPRINNIIITPKVTTVPNDNIKVRVDATDNEEIISAEGKFLGSKFNLSLNNTTNLFEATVQGPAEDGVFLFNIKVTDNNDNSVEARYAKLTVDTTAPNVTITNPQEGQIIKEILVDIQFTVNEIISNSTFVLDSGPEQLATLPGFTLNTTHGKHILQIFATDPAGNIGSDIVNFEIPVDNVEIVSIDFPSVAKPTDDVEVIFEIRNTGNDTENLTVQFLQDGSFLDDKLITLASGKKLVSKFDYIPILGEHNLTVKALPVPGETHLVDNELTETIFVSDKIVALLVDDEFNSTTTSVYKKAITNAGLEFLPIDTETRKVTSSLLEDFGLVVWFTGNDENTLNGIERAILQEYINNGGFLLISGKNIGEDISDKTFYKNSLHAEFLGEVTGLRNLAGIPGDPISRGLLVDIAESGEQINPADEFGTAIFNYIGDGTAAIRVDDGNNKVIYLAFGFENLEDENERNIIMNRIINHLDIDVDAPKILSVEPESRIGLPINTKNVTLKIITDEIAECRISDEFGLRFKDMNVFDVTNSTTNSVLITNLENENNITKFIKCRDRKRNTVSFSHDFLVNNRTFLPPTLQPIPEQIINENETLLIKLNASDPENDTLTITIEDILAINFPKPIASRFNIINNTLKLETNFDDSGNYNLRVKVNDGTDTVFDDFLLTISNVNRKPVIQPIPTLNAKEDNFFSYTVIASDPDNDPIRFTDNTPLFNINFFTGFIGFTPRQEQVGTHDVKISVSDGNLTESKVVIVNVKPTNDPPSIDFVSPQFATAGILFELQVKASDPDDDSFSFFDNTTLFNISSTGLISFIPKFVDVGTHFIELMVSDGLLEASKILNLIVQAVNRAPIVVNITKSITVLPTQVANITVEACDPDIDVNCK